MGDSFSGIENLTGSAFDDVLSGDSAGQYHRRAARVGDNL